MWKAHRRWAKKSYPGRMIEKIRFFETKNPKAFPIFGCHQHGIEEWELSPKDWFRNFEHYVGVGWEISKVSKKEYYHWVMKLSL